MAQASRLEWYKALRERGHANYAAYLQSPAWWSLRARILDRDEHRCRFCRSRAWQVHHVVYDPDTLDGKALETLISVCGSCHEHVTLLAARVAEDGPDALLAPIRQVKAPALGVSRRWTAKGSRTRQRRSRGPRKQGRPKLRRP